MDKLISKINQINPVLGRSFTSHTGETRVVGTTPGSISDVNRQKKMEYTYSSLR